MAAIVAQPNELGLVLMVLNGGMFLWQPSEGVYLEERRKPVEQSFKDPFIVGSSREYLRRHSFGSWTSTLFSYIPPRIYFRLSEQRLLLAALKGLTDQELADELIISLSAIKKTWRNVYERAARILPDELAGSAIEGEDTKRGKEKKQHLLAYLLGHMEELRPVLPPRE
jgi:hypothetical protein